MHKSYVGDIILTGDFNARIGTLLDFPLPLGDWEGLRFVIVALPRLFSYFFSCNMTMSHLIKIIVKHLSTIYRISLICEII